MSDADDKRGKMVPELVSTLDLINKINKLKCDVFSLKEQIVQQGVELHNTKAMLKMHEEWLDQRNAHLDKAIKLLGEMFKFWNYYMRIEPKAQEKYDAEAKDLLRHTAAMAELTEKKPSKFSDPNACPECGSDDWLEVLPPICACCGYGESDGKGDE